jgi:flagellar hook assembly protein FlgD
LNGTIEFRLPPLSEGNHKILLKAWDVFNNSSEYTLLCKVVKQDSIKVVRLFNYPNPVYHSTQFSFSLEGPYAGARAELTILTVEGQALRTLTKAINETGLRSIEIEWNGRDEKGNRLGRGVYVYQLTIMSKTGKLTRKVQKLIIV